MPSARSRRRSVSWTMPSWTGGDCRVCTARRLQCHAALTRTRNAPNTHMPITNADAISDIAGSVDERNTRLAASSAPLATGGDCGSGMRLATALIAANGTTNLTAAANQTQYRADALLFRSIHASTPAATAQIVDCQR